MPETDREETDVERQLTRKQALGAAAGAGAALAATGGLGGVLARLGASPAAAATAAACATLTPSMTEGPYWVDEALRRSDVRANTATASSGLGAAQAGVPLSLRIMVLDGDNGCVPYNGAHVDIWHANAYGLYSDESGQMTGGGTSNGNTSGQNFLRGYQVTGEDAGVDASPADGRVGFKTIWPGWYSGRAIHIHVRVRAYDSTGAVATNYTTQIFFSDADNRTVLTGATPYSSRSPQDDPTSNETDNVLTSSARSTNVSPVTGSVADGFATTFTIVLHGLPKAASTVSSGSAGKTVDASLSSAKVVRAANGTRALVLSVRAGEAVTAKARLLRGPRVLGGATGKLAAGTHSLRVAVVSGAAAGTATAEVTLVDAAGNRRVVKRTVTL
jgi:protocatechuate 3,4-dioxygenase beta subunit